MTRPGIVLEFGAPTMSATPYEAAVQGEMNTMAEKAGKLAAELRIARITLSTILQYIDDGWPKDELRATIDRIDSALSPTLDEADVRRAESQP